PVVVFLSVNVATPLLLVLWLAGVIDELPAPWVGATLVPAIWLPLASRSVTVSVALSVPSASAEPGAAATLDCVASTEPATTVKELAAASSTGALSVRPEPEERLPVAPETTSLAAAPGTTVQPAEDCVRAPSL